MEMNEITLDKVNEAIKAMESRDPQRIGEILPLAITILKEKSNDISHIQAGTKLYAPIWVRQLLIRLSNDEKPLSSTEYNFFKPIVQILSINDYKPVADDFNAYEVQYLTHQEVAEMVLALKHYFNLL